MSESEMASRLITKVPADYPAVARAARIEGNVVLKAIIGTDGSVVQAQFISGNPILLRPAILCVSKWRYRPVIYEGSPVEVATTVTVAFKLSDQPQAGVSSSTTSVVDTEATSAETIQLTNGRTIHADTVTDAGQKIEYTIGESTYEIPKSLIKSITYSPGATPMEASSTVWDSSKPGSATVTGTTLSKMPIAFGEDQKNWYLYESTEQLRAECRSGEFGTRFHPEMQTASSFPNKDDAERICAILRGEANQEYERLVDRGIEIERTLCYTPGYLPGGHSTDPRIKGLQEEFAQISAELELGKRMMEFQQNPHTATTPGLRLMLDMYRLDARCGHSGF